MQFNKKIRGCSKAQWNLGAYEYGVSGKDYIKFIFILYRMGRCCTISTCSTRLFLELSKAFEIVSYSSLWKKLDQLNVSSEYLSVLVYKPREQCKVGVCIVELV